MVKDERIKQGLTQKELADIMDVSVQWVQNYEQNKRDINRMSIDLIVELCTKLNCKIEEVLTDKELIKRLKLVV